MNSTSCKSNLLQTYCIFVYGTLKTGEPNHQVMTDSKNGNAKLIGIAKTVEKYPLIIGTDYNIPFLLYSPGKGHNVEGEIYEVDETMITFLDKFEGHPDFYYRMKENFVFISEPSETIECWGYFYMKIKPELLAKPFFQSYHNEDMVKLHLPYLERNLRKNKADASSMDL